MTGLDQGVRYASGALVPESPDPQAPERRPCDYEATTRPGARLPHAWLDRAGQRVSTLDLATLDAPVLLASPAAEGWRRAAAEVGVLTASIGTGEELTDPEGTWQQVREVSEEGAILVRPDHHVGWRAFGGSPRPAEDLRAAFSSVVLQT